MDFALSEHLYTEELYRLKALPRVVLNKPWIEVTESERQLLSKILAALQLSMNSVEIVQMETLNFYVDTIKPARVIYFGSIPSSLKYYELFQVETAEVVASIPLEELSKDDNARKLLWNALKKLFAIF